MLKGAELLEFVNENEDMPTPDLVRAAGYVRTTSTGKEQLLTKTFYDALLKARGVTLKHPRSTGKAPTFETSVHESGIVLVGKTYTSRFGLQAGDVLQIELGENEIRLVPRVGVKVAPKKRTKKAKSAPAPAAAAPEDAETLESLLADEREPVAA